MKAIPLISVIIPVYNVEKYVVESINSVLNQDYQNIEIIIIDDCSTDRTYKILSENYLHLKNVKIIRNDENKKIVYSLNEGLKHCNGDYIARCDGDDIMAFDRLSKQLDYLIKNPKISLVGCSLEGINEDGIHLSYSYFPESFDLLKKIAKYSSPVSHIWLAKKEIYEELNGYRFPSVEDYDFLLRMITSGYEFANVPNYVGMKIRVREGNTVNLYGVKQRLAYNYARNCYFKRLENKNEKMSNSFDDYISNSMFSYTHTLSNKIARIAVSSRVKFIKYFMYFVSAILSPYQFQYLSHTILRRIIIKINK